MRLLRRAPFLADTIQCRGVELNSNFWFCACENGENCSRSRCHSSLPSECGARRVSPTASIGICRHPQPRTSTTLLAPGCFPDTTVRYTSAPTCSTVHCRPSCWIIPVWKPCRGQYVPPLHRNHRLRTSAPPISPAPPRRVSATCSNRNTHHCRHPRHRNPS